TLLRSLFRRNSVMRHTTRIIRISAAGLFAVLAGNATTPAAPPQPQGEQYSSKDGWKPLFNGNNLAGWKFRNPDAKKVWVVCDDVRIDPSHPGKLLPVGPGGSPSAAL